MLRKLNSLIDLPTEKRKILIPRVLNKYFYIEIRNREYLIDTDIWEKTLSIRIKKNNYPSLKFKKARGISIVWGASVVGINFYFFTIRSKLNPYYF